MGRSGGRVGLRVRVRSATSGVEAEIFLFSGVYDDIAP